MARDLKDSVHQGLIGGASLLATLFLFSLMDGMIAPAAYPVLPLPALPEDEPQAAQPAPPQTSIETWESIQVGQEDAVIETASIQLPSDIQFHWHASPSEGLAPAFLWQTAAGVYRLGDQVLTDGAPQIAQYALDAQAVVPDHYEGRLLFHRKVLHRLKQYLDQNHATGPIQITVSRPNEALVILSISNPTIKEVTHLRIFL